MGLSLLAICAQTRSSGTRTAGLVLCGLAGFGALGMWAILHWNVFGLLGPVLLILLGGWLLFRGQPGESILSRPAAE